MTYQIILKLPDKNDEDIVFDSYEDLNSIWQLLDQYDNAQLAIVPKEDENSGIPSIDSPTKIQENDGGKKTMTKEEIIQYINEKYDTSAMYDTALKQVEKRAKEEGPEAIVDLLGSDDLDKTFLASEGTMVDRMAQDAMESGLTKEELDVYGDEWLSFITRL